MYCSINDILNDIGLNEIIELTNDENRAFDQINLSDQNDAVVKRINEQILSADEEINGYLRSRYSLPLTVIPERIKTISKEIAIYNLYKRRHRLDMTDSIVSIYKSKIDELNKIQKGFIVLEIQQITSESGRGELRTNKTSVDRIFNKDLLSRF